MYLAFNGWIHLDYIKDVVLVLYWYSNSRITLFQYHSLFVSSRNLQWTANTTMYYPNVVFMLYKYMWSKQTYTRIQNILFE